MKVYTLLTQTHKFIFETYFLPSYKAINKNKQFELYVGQSKQIGETGEYGEAGFKETMINKVKMLIDVIEKNKNSFILYCDADIQFFKGFETDILKYNNTSVDLYIQNDSGPRFADSPILCAGFMIINCTTKTLAFFKKILSIIHHFEHDQYALNCIRNEINWVLLPSEKYYTISYNTNNNVWQGEHYENIPSGILMHHANWVKGIQNKIKLLEYIKQQRK